jgi:hypothetical protein
MSTIRKGAIKKMEAADCPALAPYLSYPGPALRPGIFPGKTGRLLYNEFIK